MSAFLIGFSVFFILIGVLCFLAGRDVKDENMTAGSVLVVLVSLFLLIATSIGRAVS